MSTAQSACLIIEYTYLGRIPLVENYQTNKILHLSIRNDLCLLPNTQVKNASIQYLVLNKSKLITAGRQGIFIGKK